MAGVPGGMGSSAPLDGMVCLPSESHMTQKDCVYHHLLASALSQKHLLLGIGYPRSDCQPIKGGEGNLESTSSFPAETGGKEQLEPRVVVQGEKHREQIL